MAIYRRSSRQPLVMVAVVAAIAGLVIGVVAGRLTAPDLAGQIRAARADVAPIVTSLEVIRDEYPKLLGAAAGTDAGGAQSALARARTTIAANSATWAIIDPISTAALGKALATLAGLIDARAPADQISAAVDRALTVAATLAATAAPA